MLLNNEFLASKNGFDLLNRIFLGAGEGIIIVDNKGKIKLINKRAEDIFGYDQNELIDHVIEDLIPRKYHKAHVPKRDQYINKPVTRPMGIGKTLRGLRKSGDEFPVEISLSYVEHEGDKLVIAFISDITLRKVQEDALKASKDELDQHAQGLEVKVRNRTQELEHLNLGLKSQIRERKLAEHALKDSLADLTKAEKELKDSLEKEKELNEMKSRFISMASHEFRTPLTTIQSSADLVARYTQEDQQEKREKHIFRIKNSVQNLTNILNDFLSLEKLESGTTRANYTEFGLSAIFEEISEMFEYTLKTDQRLIIYEVPKMKIKSDPHLLKNSVINLVSNAVKYSPERSNVEIITTLTQSELNITIKDQGIGISKDDQKNLFQRFFRAENATNIQGTGLGLNIVKRYIDLLGGSITFTSKENEGSEFTITLPSDKIGVQN